MDPQTELNALRAEHQRLRDHLHALGERLARMESAIAPAPVAPTPQNPAPPPPSVATAPPPPPLPVATDPSHPAPPIAPAARESLELRLGRVWLARVGILILLTGLVFLGNYAYHEFIGRLGAPGKLGLLYMAAGALAGLGAWLGRRPELHAFSRVLLAGGAAAGYYATFAAHYVPSLQVISSPALAGALLLMLGGAFVVWADRVRSRALAAATVALSFYTAAINPIGTFALFSNLVISAVALGLLARHGWMSVSFLSLLGSYGAFAFWRFQQGDAWFPESSPTPSAFLPELLFPLGYWVLHTAAGLWRTEREPARATFLTLNNAAFFALAGAVFAGTYPGQFWQFSLVCGVVLLALTPAASRRLPNERGADGALLAQGLGLVTLSILLKITGWQLPLSLALLAVTLVTVGRYRYGGVCRFFAGAVAVVAVAITGYQIVAREPASAAVAVGVAGALALAAVLLKRSAGVPRACDYRVVVFAWLALAPLLTLGFRDLPLDARFPAFAAGTLALLAAGTVRRQGEWFAAAVLVEVVAIAAWLARAPQGFASWPDAAGFLALAAATRLWPSPACRVGSMAASAAGLWAVVHALASATAGGFFITLAWAATAVLLLATGFALRERLLRGAGLAILGAAVARIVIVDVWQLETFARILSFLGLGAVLLALAFLYNRYGETLRRWL